MMRLLARVLVALLLIVTAAGPGYAQQPEKRIALVIGNAAYSSGALATPANDAGLIAQTLQAAGFDVMGARDIDAATLRSSFAEFLDKARASGPETVALVYFAGYGVQFEGHNYLVPVDAKIAHDADVPLQAVRVSDLVQPLTALPLKARMVVLDAARANSFGDQNQPLAGGLAEMQPDPGTLIAFNAAPGTIAPEGKGNYGAYATALSEMIKEGGLSLDDLFERVRLRVNELSNGAELTWQASRIEVPFRFFERSANAPAVQATKFAELRTRPVHEFGAKEAYLAAITRDTMRGYLDFLAAYPHDPLAKRVRAILAARREARTWHQSSLTDTPDAYWSYLRRYPRGPHAWDARRRLAHFAAASEPPPSFVPMDYDVPPPPPDEDVYIDRPVVSFFDPDYDLPPPPPVPVIFLPPRPAYFDELPPPPPPVEDDILPIPVYYPVQQWVERPTYVVPPPINVINVNIHNKVVINEVNQTAIVTNTAGQHLPPLPANVSTPQPTVPAQGGAAHVVPAHPAVTAAVAAAAVALPAAVQQARKAGKTRAPIASQQRPQQPAAAVHPGQSLSAPNAAKPNAASVQSAPQSASTSSKAGKADHQPEIPAPTGAKPLPMPSAGREPERPAGGIGTADHVKAGEKPVAQMPPQSGKPAANPGGPAAHSPKFEGSTGDAKAGHPTGKPVVAGPEDHRLPVPNTSARPPEHPAAGPSGPTAGKVSPTAGAHTLPVPGKPAEPTSAKAGGSGNAERQPPQQRPPASEQKEAPRPPQQAIHQQAQPSPNKASPVTASTAAEQNIRQAAQQRAAQQAAQAKAQQEAAQQRAAQARAQQAAQQRAAQEATRAKAQQEAAQQRAGQARAQQAAQQAAQRRAAEQAAQARAQQQAAQQRAAQQAAQMRAQQAAQQAAQRRAAEQAAQARAQQQAAQQRAAQQAAQMRAQQAAQQAAQQRAAQQAAQARAAAQHAAPPKAPACGQPGRPPCR